MRSWIGALCVVALAFVPLGASAQTPATADVLKKLDEKAQVFTSLQASIVTQRTDYGVKTPAESGKMYIKMEKGVPRILLDITTPKELQKTALIDKGTGTVYWPGTKQFAKQAVPPDSDVLQYLLIGFGMRSATLTKGYSATVKDEETMEGIRTMVLELKSISDVTAKYPTVTLWLNPATWTPIQTRLTEKSRAYQDFKYSDVQLNRNVPESRFHINIPKDAHQQ